MTAKLDMLRRQLQQPQSLASLSRLETELLELAWQVTGKEDGARSGVAISGKERQATKS